jgi:acetyl-CoA carboxylase biotin carboxyl carrier protein
LKIFFHFSYNYLIKNKIAPKRDKMAKNPNENDVAFIEALAELLSTQSLTEIEVNRNYGENDSLNVRISKTQNIVQTASIAPTAASPLPINSAITALSPTASDDPSSHPGAVPSPMVGTIYLQAEPGSPAFISVGTTVAEGDTILIIEAMKTMNQITAPHAGTVKRILVEDGGAVEYGAPLVIIE